MTGSAFNTTQSGGIQLYGYIPGAVDRGNLSGTNGGNGIVKIQYVPDNQLKCEYTYLMYSSSYLLMSQYLG